MAIQKDIEKEIDELFTRGVGEFIDPGSKFKEKIKAKIAGTYTKPIVIKFGVDPTRPDIHLGHAVVFRKLRKFQDLGCKVIFLVGDFTAQIGDPTGKSKVRPEIDQAEVEKNLTTYLEQLNKIISTDKAVFSWIRNSDWFTSITDLALPADYKVGVNLPEGKQVNFDSNSFVAKAIAFEKTRMQVVDLGLKDAVSVITLRSLLWTLKHITHSRLIARDMFQERIKKGEELYMHEMMYPVLQGIDSSVLSNIYGSCDLEVGGTDQTFNMLIGRDIMTLNKQEQQAVLAFKLLEGTDGKEKMSKSLDNYVGITDAPNDMYGKILSIPDSSIVNYFELATYTPKAELENLEKQLKKSDVNPKEIKMRLAREIVAIYHGDAKAKQAEENFENTFKKGGVPDDVETAQVKKGALLVDVLLEKKIIASKSEWRRLLDENAVSIMETEEKITDPFAVIEKDAVYKVGKRRFIKVNLE